MNKAILVICLIGFVLLAGCNQPQQPINPDANASPDATAGLSDADLASLDSSLEELDAGLDDINSLDELDVPEFDESDFE